MTRRPLSLPACDAPAQPCQHHGLAEQSRAEQAEHDEGHRGNADHRNEQQHHQHGSQQHRDERGQHRLSRLRLECLHATDQPIAKQQGKRRIERQEGKRQFPCPAQARLQRQRTSIEQAMLDPAAQPADRAEVAGDDVLDAAVNNCGGVALQRARDGEDIAADLRMGSKFDASQHRHRVSINLAVDVRVAENGDRTVAHRSGDAVVAENRDDIAGITLASRGSENRHHGVGVFPARQH